MSNDDEDENNNCIVGNTCQNNTKCSIHGNCYYDIISLYKDNQSFILNDIIILARGRSPLLMASVALFFFFSL